jgi:hypothetical protein
MNLRTVITNLYQKFLTSCTFKDYETGSLMTLKSSKLNVGNAKGKCFSLDLWLIKKYVINLEQIQCSSIQCTLAEKFGNFFYRKNELTKKKIDDVPLVVEHCFPEVKFESFSPVSDDEVSNIIMSSSNTSCQLDSISTWLLKICCNVLSPSITRMINLSLVEEIWKSALVLPLLKKLGLDSLFENFRPVSNLPFVAKLTEKEVVGQLLNHCNVNALLPVNQSAYRQFHSTETSLLKAQRDILSNMDNQEVVLLVMFDLSAAFDTIDHRILLDILEKDLVWLVMLRNGPCPLL